MTLEHFCCPDDEAVITGEQAGFLSVYMFDMFDIVVLCLHDHAMFFLDEYFFVHVHEDY